MTVATVALQKMKSHQTLGWSPDTSATGAADVRFSRIGVGAAGIAMAPAATANYGLFSLGSGPFDGTASGFFTGSAAGTYLAINATSSFTGNFFDIQQPNTEMPTSPVLMRLGYFTDGYTDTYGLRQNSILPATLARDTYGQYFATYTRGTSAFVPVGCYFGLRNATSGGYTGPNVTIALTATNFISGTNTVLVGQWFGAGNMAARFSAAGAGTGLSVGAWAAARGSTTGNIALYGNGVLFSAGSGYTVGVMGMARKLSDTPPTKQIGGFFGLYNADGFSYVSSALLVDNADQTDPIALFRDGGTTVFSIENGFPGTVRYGASTVASFGESLIDVAITLPATTQTSSFYIAGSRWFMTPQTSTAIDNVGIEVQFLAGYTGSSASIALKASNVSAGTGTFLTSAAGAANNALAGVTIATTTGTCIGVSGQGGGGDISAGVVGFCSTTKANATSIGVAGLCANAGSSAVVVGGVFSLQTSNPTLSSSAALVCDTAGVTTAPAFVARINGTAKFQVDPKGYPVIITGSGAPADAQADGALYLDTTNFKIYARCGGAWKASAAFT